MAFSVPTLVASGVSSGAVTSLNVSYALTVPVGTEVCVAVTSGSLSTNVSGITDTQSNKFYLFNILGEGMPGNYMYIFKGIINAQVTASDHMTVSVSGSQDVMVLAVGSKYPLSLSDGVMGAFGTGTASSVTWPGVNFSPEYVLAFSVNATAVPTWTAPATSLGTVSGNGFQFTTAYQSTSFAVTMGTTWSGSQGWFIGSAALMANYTDLYTDPYTGLYGQYLAQPWPASGPLAVKCELLLNGNWTDITSFVYQRDGSVNVHITHGRPNEASSVVTADMTLQLNNRNGTFTPLNPASPYFPFIQRNTQIRFSAQQDFNGPDAGYRYFFWGEVSAWPPSWDVTGQDVWVSLEAAGIIRRLNQSKGTIGSALRRWYMTKATTDPTFPVAYWPAEDGSTSSQLAEVTGLGAAATFSGGTPSLASDSSFAGSDPLPVLKSGSAWSGFTGSYSPPGDVTYTVPGTYQWTAPAGTSTVDVKAVGGGGGGASATTGHNGGTGGGGGGEYAEEAAYAVTPGNAYTVVVGAGGVGGTTTTINGTAGGKTSFDGTGVVAHGGGGGGYEVAGTGGTGSTNTTHHAGGAGYTASNVAGGGGASGGSAAAGTSATSATGAAAVTYGGPGGDGGTASGGTQNFTKTYTATHSYAYQGSDAGNALLHTDSTIQQGGDIPDTTNGKSKSWLLFNYAQIASDLSGATITKVTLTIYTWHWWFGSGGTLCVGWDTTTSFPATKADPTLHPDLVEFSMTPGEVGTLNLGTAFGTAFQSSSATSIVLFKNSNSLTYYMKGNGATQSNAPYLTISYTK